jgi:hypothetical protein
MVHIMFRATESKGNGAMSRLSLHPTVELPPWARIAALATAAAAAGMILAGGIGPLAIHAPNHAYVADTMNQDQAAHKGSQAVVSTDYQAAHKGAQSMVSTSGQAAHKASQAMVTFAAAVSADSSTSHKGSQSM